MSNTSVIGGVVLVFSGIVKIKFWGKGPRGGNVAINSQLKKSIFMEQVSLGDTI